jgi:hypothetical protein
MDEQQMLKLYESEARDIEPFIGKTLRDAVDSHRPELENIHKYETQQLPAFYDAFNAYGMGTGPGQMSSGAQLSKAFGDVGRQSALANVSRGIFDVRKQSVDDLIGQTYRQWQSGYGAAQNAYDRYWQQQQEQRRQFEADRAYELRGYGDIFSQIAKYLRDQQPDENTLIQNEQQRLRQLFDGGTRKDPVTGDYIVGSVRADGTRYYNLSPTVPAGSGSIYKK